MSALGQFRTHALQRMSAYSSTASARASKVDGRVRPSDFPVERLMTSSKFVGRSTGRGTRGRAFQNFVNIVGRAAVVRTEVQPVGHQAAGIDILSDLEDCW